MTERLSDKSLELVPPAIERTRYDRSALKPGVVHIGIGAFHRAHQAPVFDALGEAGDLRWGILGASLRSPAVCKMLVPQDCLYSVVVEEDERRSIRIVRSVLDVIVASQDPRRLIEAIASDHAHIVTISVTEKGYCLSKDAPADLSIADPQLTMPACLAAGLHLREQKGLPGVSVISCDNLSHNGRRLSDAVLEAAYPHGGGLADWIARNCTFPNSMVDRIVPARREEDIERIAAELGLVDCAAVVTEPFSQWVIEDCFAGERPALERVGVTFTNDIAPWEEAKLRLLNGAHSAMAYLGGLAGISTVAQFVSLPWGLAFVDLLWDELEQTLRPRAGLSVREYRAALKRRFSNLALRHKLVQIAMDGSQKIPQRLVPAAAEIRSRGRQAESIALAIAAWIRWQTGRDDQGRLFAVDDPLAATTKRLLERAGRPLDQVRAILSLRSLFPEPLAADGKFQSSVAKHLERLFRLGARATVEQFVAQHFPVPGRRAQG